MSFGSIAIMAMAILGCCVVLAEGIIVKAFQSAAARQPEMEPRLFSRMIVGIAFVEGTYFVTLAMAFVFAGM
ncbi:MAG: ATP F0F1 synthase subunit C [Lactovum sp.]